MLSLNFLLIATAAALPAVAIAMLGYDAYQNAAARKRLEAAECRAEKLPEAELKLRAQLAGMICGVALLSFIVLSSFDVARRVIRCG